MPRPIREHYGFRDLEGDAAAGFRLTRWLYVLCWTGDDRPGLLFDRATTWLLAHKVLLPGITTLERLISRVRHRATLRLWHRLTRPLTDEQRQKLVALVTSVTTRSPRWRTCARRRSGARRRSCSGIWSASMPSAATAWAWRHAPTCRPPRSDDLARSARITKPANLAALHEPRRTATLAALFQTLEAMALDDAVELFDALATDIFALAEAAHRKSRLRSLRDLDAAASCCATSAGMSWPTETTRCGSPRGGMPCSSRSPGPTSGRHGQRRQPGHRARRPAVSGAAPALAARAHAVPRPAAADDLRCDACGRAGRRSAELPARRG